MKKLRTEMSARSQNLRAKINDKINLRAKNGRIKHRKTNEKLSPEFNKFREVVKWADAHREELLDICAMQKELSSYGISCDILTGDNILVIDLMLEGVAIEYKMGNRDEKVFTLYDVGTHERLVTAWDIEDFIEMMAESEFADRGADFDKAISKWMKMYMNDEYLEEVMDKFESFADGITDEYPDEVDESARKLNITKKQYNESRYFQKKYGKLKYVSESGKLFKTSKGNILKFMKESVGTASGSGVGITCNITLKGNSPEEVIQNLHEKLLNLDAAITDGNENPNPDIVDKYNHWDEENEGDVSFAINDPNRDIDGVQCEIYSEN